MRSASVIMYKEEVITIIMLTKWWICILSNQFNYSIQFMGQTRSISLILTAVNTKICKITNRSVGLFVNQIYLLHQCKMSAQLCSFCMPEVLTQYTASVCITGVCQIYHCSLIRNKYLNLSFL